MSFDSHSISEGFKGKWNRLKTTKISKSDITEKLKVTKISKADFTEMMKKVAASDITGKVKNGVNQVTSYAKTVADKIPLEKASDKGTIELDSRGYQVYNIEDTGEIYIAQIPEKATFDEKEIIVTRATPDMFVGEVEEEKVEEAVSTQKQAVDVESLFHKAVRGGSVVVPVTIGTNNGGVIEECAAPGSEDINIERVYADRDMDPIIIMPVTEEEPVMEAPVEAPVTVTPVLNKIEVEPLTKTEEPAEMLQSAECFINSMYETAETSSAPEVLKCNPMEDGSYSKDPVTPIKEKKDTSRAPRFVFKDGKLQMVAPEENASAFTVNRSESAEDEVPEAFEEALQDYESFDNDQADMLDCIPDDGMEAMPFPVRKPVEKTDRKVTESDCGKVTFDFDNRSSDDGFVGFSF